LCRQNIRDTLTNRHERPCRERWQPPQLLVAAGQPALERIRGQFPLDYNSGAVAAIVDMWLKFPEKNSDESLNVHAP
jgi:hypothetical protein